ncbi:uncharacterized protein TNCV_4071991 [Trichonephila clavipes]|uniref:Uncharacterized protein n=1 Tax=Trichonephila clavipes TaxID=2585209 RepID=A0A8X6W8T7_TRICX|nr:uncharacterized protein TNCV_4071991 [Trichonephila clavipes]
MIANYVNEQHDTWDHFLREFAYAIRTAVNVTTGKTPAELFLGRKLITPFQKLVMVSDGTEFAVGDIERLKKSRSAETITPTTSGYNLRPRKGKREESRLTIERKTQQGGPVRSRKGRERKDSPYIEERTRSSNKNARRGGDQQRQDQERRGTCTKKSLSL